VGIPDKGFTARLTSEIMLQDAEADHQLAAVFSYGWLRTADTWGGRVVFLVLHGALFHALPAI
jgi:hypothetical protein